MTYSSPPLIRPPIMQRKSGLLRGVASLEGIILQCFTVSVHLKSGLIRVVAFVWNVLGVVIPKGSHYTVYF